MYTCIKSFYTKRGNYIPRGREVGQLFYLFLSKQNKRNFVLTDFYDTPEDDYRRELGEEDSDEISVVSTFMPQSELMIPQANDLEVPFGGGSGGGGGARGNWADFHPHEDFNEAEGAPVIQMFSQPDYQPSDSVQVPDPEVPDYLHMDPSDDRPMFPQDSDPVIGVQQDYSSPQQDSYDSVSDSGSDYSDSTSSDSSSSDN